MYQEYYRVNLPYPELSPEVRDPRLAAKLSAMYIGRNGELESVSEFLYLALRTEKTAPSLSELFSAAAEIEMKHFQVLGKLIRDLGKNPTIRTQIETSVIADTNEDKIRPILKKVIFRLRQSIAKYQFYLTQTADPSVKVLLHRILLDEEHLANAFEQILHQ